MKNVRQGTSPETQQTDEMIDGTVGYGVGLREGAMASSRSSEGVCEVAVFLDSIIRSTRPCIRKELISIALSLALSSDATVFLSKSNWA
ncbi:MAG: hypothetical protein OEV11_14715, partial [Deltaproteobacteria bacterium]|nr:hypothetical protein [Deltaproteobacteria bacterium]